MKYKKIKSLKILGRDYRVHHREMKKLDGNCCPDKELITISPKADNKPRTVYHEMVHAIAFSGAIYEALEGNRALIEVICEQVARVFDENFEYTPRKHCE